MWCDWSDPGGSLLDAPGYKAHFPPLPSFISALPPSLFFFIFQHATPINTHKSLIESTFIILSPCADSTYTLWDHLRNLCQLPNSHRPTEQWWTNSSTQVFRDCSILSKRHCNSHNGHDTAAHSNMGPHHLVRHPQVHHEWPPGPWGIRLSPEHPRSLQIVLGRWKIPKKPSTE